MNVCASCGKRVEIDKYFSRKSACPNCGGDLRVCLNCRFYSVTSHNKCLETKAEFQRSRDKANFCDYFVFRESASSSVDDRRGDALKQLNDLFKK